MKTKTIILLCLFMGLAVTQLSAQNGKGGTGSVPTVYFIDWPSNIPVYCDGVQIDMVTATNFNSKAVDHFVLGLIDWEIAKINGVTYKSSSSSGETFVVNGTQKYDANAGLFYLNANLNGNMGNHYILKLVMQGDGSVIEVRSNCH
jgi:hypothetical protein